MKFDCIIGIDPGSNGGIAIWSDKGVELKKMPKDIKEVAAILEAAKSGHNSLVLLERLNVRPDDTLVNYSAKTINYGKLYRIQKMMANYEQLRAVINLASLPLVLIHPLTWQSALKLRKNPFVSKAARKAQYKAVAALLYPSTKQTLWSADATLIMHYGRMKNGNLKWLADALNRSR